MKESPLAEATRIVLTGVRNAGKSSLMNNLFEKNTAIVSDTPGTTTDPVTRKIELGRLGPCALTDTAGFDDVGELGGLRTEKTLGRLKTADLVLFVTPGHRPMLKEERKILDSLEEGKTPWIGVVTFGDREIHREKKSLFPAGQSLIVDNGRRESARNLIKLMEQKAPQVTREITPMEGLVREQDLILLVTPIDLAAPAGRLILPQVETIRDLLDRDCAALVLKERELYGFYRNLGIKPSLVITDSQAFHKVAADIPEDQPLTSFSLLFARKKGDLPFFIESLKALNNFPEKGRILVMEACSHHKQADDLGTVKIPRLFRQLVGSQVEFGHSRTVPKRPEEWDMVIHCAGCMVTRKAMLAKVEIFREKGIPVLNYGLFLAWANGLLPRALEPFPELVALYEE
ncbi:MAG: [FeFe] hydrogenase H-cluster maturation GTPase HydF [Spirochaetales bacterium]|nr:[FeFe] hydrogenase H-cluster maturation GTPase HydF [Spirochaetales bacterium]